MFSPLQIIILQTYYKSDYTTSRHITKSFLSECFHYLCRKSILKKLKNNVFLVTEGQAEIMIVKFVNALSTKIGDFLSKTIQSTGISIHIIITKMLFLHTFIRDSCSVGLLL